MVIKERYKGLKNLHKAEGFMLLEAVALVGFVALVGIEITSLHGLIMNAYHETDIRMRALSYAEDGMASTLTGISTSPGITVDSQKKSIFKSEITTTHGVSFLPTQKPFTIVTVKVSWREQGQEKKIELTRLATDDQVPL
jgi:hypothetical protein